MTSDVAIPRWLEPYAAGEKMGWSQNYMAYYGVDGSADDDPEYEERIVMQRPSLVGYASRTGTRRNLATLQDADWRLLVSAKGALRTEGMRYALDNGAWSAFVQQEPFDENAFSLLLTGLARARTGSSFRTSSPVGLCRSITRYGGKSVYAACRPNCLLQFRTECRSTMLPACFLQQSESSSAGRPSGKKPRRKPGVPSLGVGTAACMLAGSIRPVEYASAQLLVRTASTARALADTPKHCPGWIGRRDRRICSRPPASRLKKRS